jgi:ParB family transcriptional regulator, chromosome partitioning protein
MARKNLLADLVDPAPAPETKGITRISGQPAEPMAKIDAPTPAPPQHRRPGAIGAMSRTLEAISAELDAAKIVSAALGKGEQIVDLDPALIDSAFIADRLTLDEPSVAALAEAIAEHGQQSPILVRPHPSQTGRFQAAYGHRRLAAVKRIGGLVRAFIRPLSDEALVLAQGQENSAREDLTYIERTQFASALARAGFTRQTIMAALSIDKTELSRMLSLGESLPEALIELIGPARGAGRRPWMVLAERLAAHPPQALDELLQRRLELARLESSERLSLVLSVLAGRNSEAGQGAVVLAARTGAPIARLSGRGKSERIQFDGVVAPGFAAFVARELERLFAAFQTEKRLDKK